MDDIASKSIADFLAFLRDCEQQMHMAIADEQEANSKTQDILHSLELEDHTYHEHAALAKELRTIRKDRRKAKDAMAVYQPIIDWIEANRSTLKGMEQLLGAVRKAEKSTGDRIYTPRTKRS